MTESFVPRTVSFQHDRETVSIDAETALSDPRLRGRPLILLGEAGSGKSELLELWTRRYVGCQVATARQMTSGRRLTQQRCLVDGLDEAAGLRDGDALERLLGALEASQNNDFVVACRVADWRSASGASTIRGWTGIDPIELTIEPLRSDDIVRFLVGQNGLSQDAAEEFVIHYEDRGLSAWLGNPQTLKMLGDVTRGELRPGTTGDLFKMYVEKAWPEHRRQDTPLANARQRTVLMALGALFAALIVGGYDAVTFAPGAERSDGDLPYAELKVLPGVAGLTDDQLNAFLDSRLVARAGTDRLTYQHRRIGEYLGAKWLAAQATTCEMRARLLGALKHDGLVPSNLRGLWGWLCDDPDLASAVIQTDPLAVIEYGDADSLDVDAAKQLLTAIQHAEDDHQNFGWLEYRAAALLKPELSEEVEKILSVHDEKRFWTQFIVLRQLKNIDVVSRHKTSLLALMLDEVRPYAIRRDAADALANHGALNDWPALIQRLVESSILGSLRLALDIMRNPNVGVVLSDAEFAEAVFAYCGLTQRFTGSREVGTVDLYYYGPRNVIRDDRLDGMLDALTYCASLYLTEERNTDAWNVEYLFFALLRRRLECGIVDADQVWKWLRDTRHKFHGVRGDKAEWLDDWLQKHDFLRRQLQRKVLESCSANPRSLLWRFREVARGLLPTIDDVVELLGWLPAGDARWSELIWLVPSSGEGERARAAAERHVRTEEDRQLLKNHADPQPQPVDLEHIAWEEEHKRTQQERQDNLRSTYLANRDRMKCGDWGALTGPAHVYMGRTHEVESDLPPEYRIGSWIGEDLQENALAGFEAFLVADPPKPPKALQIAESNAKSRHWPSGLILSAALAERYRTGRGFTDLSIERLQAGLFAERVAFIDDNTWEDLRNALTSELERRGAWVETACLFIEPQLRKRLSYVSWLWGVLASNIGTELSVKWLREFPRVAAEPEEAMIDQLLRDNGLESRQVLAEVAIRRRHQKLDARRLSHWQMVELILGSLPPSELATIAARNRDFIWPLRDRMGKRRRNAASIDVAPELLASVVASFAPMWPHAVHPKGVTTGDVNPWDATQFLRGCLASLAADPKATSAAALATLKGIDYGYGSIISHSIADQRRACANAEWQPRKVEALADLVTDGPPIDHADFQRVVLAELDRVQAQISSGSEDVWRFFYADAQKLKPNKEDHCSDALVTLLKQSDRRVGFDREKHLGNDREGDIWCNSPGLELAVECKRHWHADLWTAFDWQLAQQQAVDWRAQGYGIYLVFWFGMHVQTITTPPRGSGIVKPRSPKELETALTHRIQNANLPRIAVKVLDVSRSCP